MALTLIAFTLIGVALGRYPVLRMNRATIALVGATALVAVGAISLEEAYDSVDADTIVVLLAMMIINANLRIAGFFGLVADRLLHATHSQRRLLFLLMVVAGLLSALFLN
ncbi:MAG TPA: SLC13 family permease, partial [Rhodothermales bacterium]